MSIVESRNQILKRIQAACRATRRNESEVLLLAVSKKQDLKKINEAHVAGQIHFAENYIQEYLDKKNNLSNSKIKWHLIGPIQSNKISKIIGEFELIHSVDSLKIAKLISEKSTLKNINQKILIQINTSGEESKSGLSIDEFKSQAQDFFSLKGIKIEGFMTMPPFSEDPEKSRPFFQKLAQLKKEYHKNGLQHLSMGTTQDFEVAIQEGATIIRVGEALFGPRV